MQNLILKPDETIESIKENYVNSIYPIYAFEIVSETCPACERQLEYFMQLEEYYKAIPFKLYLISLIEPNNKAFAKRNGFKFMPTTLFVKHAQVENLVGLYELEELNTKIRQIDSICLNCKSHSIGKRPTNKEEVAPLMRCKLHRNWIYPTDNCSKFQIKKIIKA
jgi:hypothetical protein